MLNFTQDSSSQLADISSQLIAVNGAPKGVYATLSALTTAFPSGNTNIYLVSANGNWYYWNGSVWTAGGVYQATTGNSITSDMTTDNSQFGLLSYDSKPIDFNFTLNQITITANTILIFKKARYVLTAQVIDISSYNTTPIYSMYYNKISNTFKFVATSAMASVAETDILVATFCKTAKTVSIAGNCTINGGLNLTDNSISAIKLTDASSMGLLISDNAYPNFDFTLNQITFYPNTILIYKRNRYVIATSTNRVVSISTGTTEQFGLFYNKTTDTFSVYTTPQIQGGSATENDILIASYHKPKKLVFMAGGYTVNGVLYGINISTSTLSSRLFGKIGNFLGDSITWGYSPADGTQLANPFPTLVKNTLGLITANNYGISGSTIADPGDGGRNPYCTRYTGMSDSGDLIFVLGGLNDWANNITVGTISDSTIYTFYGALNTLITGLLNKYPTQTIVLATPLHRNGDTVPNTASATLNDYRNAIISIGAKYGIVVLDLYATSGFYPDNTTNYNAICPDGRHPNDAGHIKLANRISGFLLTV